MALYRLEVKIIGRAPTGKSPNGQNAVAAAAYRTGERLVDETTGKVSDFRPRKPSILFSGLFVPADAPAWMKDRQKLWNRVERMEKRSDAQLAREYLLSLPHELSHEQRFQLVRDFVRENFVRHGLVCDVAIHAPDKNGDRRNYHAHLMVALRCVEGDGFSKNKYRAMNGKAHVRQIRAAYAKLCNRYLKNAGHSVRVDHRAKTGKQFVTAARCFAARKKAAAVIAETGYVASKHPRSRFSVGHHGNPKRALRDAPPLHWSRPAMLTKPLCPAPSYVPIPDVPSQMGAGQFRRYGQAPLRSAMLPLRRAAVNMSTGSPAMPSPTYRPVAGWPEDMKRDHSAVMQGRMTETVFNDKWGDHLAGRVKSETAVVAEIFYRRPHREP